MRRMDLKLINEELFLKLYSQAHTNGRLRQAYDLRTTPEDNSQRMLNVLLPGTHVPIHRHMKTSETNICLEGCLDVIFYEERPNVVSSGPIYDGGKTVDETAFKEVARIRLCPRVKKYGIQIPLMAWHTIEVYEPSIIIEAKDGMYGQE